MRRSAPLISIFFAALGLLTLTGSTVFSQPAGRRIDVEIDKGLAARKVPASPAADDAEFLRRVYLDLTGRIPPYDKTVAFLASQEPDRRAKLIDELLASPEFGKHFGGFWSQLLLGQEIANAPREIFRVWLTERLNQGQRWDQTVRDMLTSEGDPKKNPATVFILAQTDDNKLQANVLAAATTRYFMGVQLQCAECHNHPFTKWKQTEFWGVAAFFTKVKNVPATKDAILTGVTEAAAPIDPKKAEAKKKAKTPAEIGPAIVIPNTAGKGAGKLVRAKFLDAEEPDLGKEGPYRPSLAQWVTARDNPYFARATVNRLWAHLFGRGLVNPVDDMHSENEASHPELLQWLAEEFKTSGFDMKHLLRTMCNSQAYQRTSRPVEANKDDREAFSHMSAKVMNAEVLYEALTQALGVKELNVTTGATATVGIGGAKKGGVVSHRDRFIRFFKTQDADSVATDFTHGIPQALNLMNDPQFNKGGPVVDALLKAKLPREQALERLFLTVLARRPTGTETKVLGRYLDSQSDPARGYADVLWVLVNTPEFILIR